MAFYPDGHHWTCWLRDELLALGADFQWDDPRIEVGVGIEGPFSVNGVAVALLLDNRVPAARARQDPAARRMLQRGDVLVCHAQRFDAERVGGFWLPLAVTPRYDRAVAPVEKTHAAAFVGYLHEARRKAFVEAIAAQVDVNVASGVFYEDAAAVYHAAHVGLNVPSDVGADYSYDINMRTFEIMAAGVPLVTADNPALRDLGIYDGVHCLTYHTPDEAAAHIRLLMKKPHIGAALADAAYRLVIDKHTYRKRAEALLAMVERFKAPQRETVAYVG